MRPIVHIFGPEAGLEDAAWDAKLGDVYHCDNGKDYKMSQSDPNGPIWWEPVSADPVAPQSETLEAPVGNVEVTVKLEEDPAPVEEEPAPAPKKKRTKKDK